MPMYSFIWKPIRKKHDRASTPRNRPFLRRVSIKLTSGLASFMRRISPPDRPQQQNPAYHRDFAHYFPTMYHRNADSTAADHGSPADSRGDSMEVSRYFSDGVMTDSSGSFDDLSIDHFGDSSADSMALSDFCDDGYIADRDSSPDRDSSLSSLADFMNLSLYRSDSSIPDGDLSETPMQDFNRPRMRSNILSMISTDQPTTSHEDDIMDVSTYGNNHAYSHINHPTEGFYSHDPMDTSPSTSLDAGWRLVSSLATQKNITPTPVGETGNGSYEPCF